MKDNLKMMFDMVKEYIDIPMVKWANLCGKKAKQIIDYIQNNNKNIELDVNARDNKNNLLMKYNELDYINIIITIKLILIYFL